MAMISNAAADISLAIAVFVLQAPIIWLLLFRFNDMLLSTHIGTISFVALQTAVVAAPSFIKDTNTVMLIVSSIMTILFVYMSVAYMCIENHS